MDVIARGETTKQSPGFRRLEIATSAFGLLAMTTPRIGLDGAVAPVSGRFERAIQSGSQMAKPDKRFAMVDVV